MTREAVIFDMDGTLADLTHRLWHIIGYPKNYDAFFDAVEQDMPITPMIRLTEIIDKARITILLVSGRPERSRKGTENWLDKHNVPYQELYMRPDGDFRKDSIVKSQILDHILSEGYDILFTVDDRPSVVAMWRERGITCLHCREWIEAEVTAHGGIKQGLLSLMIGPAGAGKSSWLNGDAVTKYNLHASQIVSSDQVRAELSGDFKDQTKNGLVFEAVHKIAKARITAGLPALIDATNLRRQDRLACVGLANGGPVRYFVLDRPIEDKRRDGGWRNDLGFDLIGKHHQTFQSQLKDILAGDSLSNVEVVDLRTVI